MTIASVSVGNLFIWKDLVLKEVARVFTDPEMQLIQQETGVWQHGGNIAYPKASEISVVKNGCLTFSALIGKESVLFSIWMQPGEVRIGVKIPNCYIGTTLHRETLSKMFDGQFCERVSAMETSTFFDWIWKNEEFASFEFMVQSMHDELKASVLAERLSQALIHLFLATVSTLITLQKLSIIDGRVVQAGMAVWDAIVAGDVDALEYYLERNGGGLLKKTISPDRRQHNCVFVFPHDRRRSIDALVGETIRDQDGSQCVVVKATADAAQ